MCDCSQLVQHDIGGFLLDPIMYFSRWFVSGWMIPYMKNLVRLYKWSDKIEFVGEIVGMWIVINVMFVSVVENSQTFV